MSEFDFTDLMYDPDFSELYTILRNTYTWEGPRMVLNVSEIEAQGIIEQPSEEVIQGVGFNLDEGNTLFYSDALLVTAADANTENAADVLKWDSTNYRVMKRKNYSKYGFNIYQCRRDNTEDLTNDSEP